MFKSTIAALLIAVTASSAYASSEDVIPVERFQPTITQEIAPDKPHGWNIAFHIHRNMMGRFSPIVPAYNGQGKLIASWTPKYGRTFDRPTFIVIHGGHGITPGNLDTALWLQRTFDANVMILDSYWSRGRTDNWKAWTEYGANMRVLDLIAAARFTQSEGADPKKTFVVGDSQGGWTVLRAFTNHNLSGEVNNLLAGGVSLYPNCYAKESFFSSAPNGSSNKEFAPPLGNYTGPVIAFTGTADTATPLSQCNVDKVLKTTEKWLNFEGATHAWDAANRGPGNTPVDGECERALNVYNRFQVCRNNRYTEITRREIELFVGRYIAK